MTTTPGPLHDRERIMGATRKLVPGANGLLPTQAQADMDAAFPLLDSTGILILLKAYMPFDPEAREHQSAVNMAFVNRAAPDTRQKLQSQDSFAEVTVGQSLEEMLIPTGSYI
ncbi:hypothetical protein APTSU1_001544100 [Apodemus speciosus]|uniref:Uncharacterized protein n=1 Tax=Apodemus speciosus TaxID=105296 RepID=A0ABQ0FLT0_APOSI